VLCKLNDDDDEFVLTTKFFKMLLFGSRAFSIAARPQAWNEPPADIHNTATYSTFKYHLKSF